MSGSKRRKEVRTYTVPVQQENIPGTDCSVSSLMLKKLDFSVLIGSALFGEPDDSAEAESKAASATYTR